MPAYQEAKQFNLEKITLQFRRDKDGFPIAGNEIIFTFEYNITGKFLAGFPRDLANNALIKITPDAPFTSCYYIYPQDTKLYILKSDRAEPHIKDPLAFCYFFDKKDIEFLEEAFEKAGIEFKIEDFWKNLSNAVNKFTNRRTTYDGIYYTGGSQLTDTINCKILVDFTSSFNKRTPKLSHNAAPLIDLLATKPMPINKEQKITIEKIEKFSKESSTIPIVEGTERFDTLRIQLANRIPPSFFPHSSSKNYVIDREQGTVHIWFYRGFENTLNITYHTDNISLIIEKKESTTWRQPPADFNCEDLACIKDKMKLIGILLPSNLEKLVTPGTTINANAIELKPSGITIPNLEPSKKILNSSNLTEYVTQSLKNIQNLEKKTDKHKSAIKELAKQITNCPHILKTIVEEAVKTTPPCAGTISVLNEILNAIDRERLQKSLLPTYLINILLESHEFSPIKTITTASVMSILGLVVVGGTIIPLALGAVPALFYGINHFSPLPNEIEKRKLIILTLEKIYSRCSDEQKIEIKNVLEQLSKHLPNALKEVRTLAKETFDKITVSYAELIALHFPQVPANNQDQALTIEIK